MLQYWECTHCSRSRELGRSEAQLVEHVADAILTTCSRWFCSQSPLLVPTLMLFAQPLRAIGCINICAHDNIFKHWWPCWTRENTAHTRSTLENNVAAQVVGDWKQSDTQFIWTENGHIHSSSGLKMVTSTIHLDWKWSHPQFIWTEKGHTRNSSGLKTATYTIHLDWEWPQAQSICTEFGHTHNSLTENGHIHNPSGLKMVTDTIHQDWKWSHTQSTWTENGHIHNSSPKTWVYYLRKKRNTEEKNHNKDCLWKI